MVRRILVASQGQCYRHPSSWLPLFLSCVDVPVALKSRSISLVRYSTWHTTPAHCRLCTVLSYAQQPAPPIDIVSLARNLAQAHLSRGIATDMPASVLSPVAWYLLNPCLMGTNTSGNPASTWPCPFPPPVGRMTKGLAIN